MRKHLLRMLVVGVVMASAGGLAGGLGMFSSASASGPSVTVSSFSSMVGSPAKIDVQALDIVAPGLGAWTVDIQYDPSIIAVASCVADQGGLCNPAYHANTVRVTGTNVYGLQHNVALASIGVVCKVAGSSGLTPTAPVLADATIGHPEPIAVTLESGKATCTKEPTPTPTPTSTPTHKPEPTATPTASELKVPGDADCNHQVTAVDATIILQYVAGLIHSVPCPLNADVNHDGVVNALDAALVLQMVAGLT